MKICVAGLGLIGGSICMALRRAGYGADGWNRSAAPLEFALKRASYVPPQKVLKGMTWFSSAFPRVRP